MGKKEQVERIIETLSHCVDFGDPKNYYENLVQIREEAKISKELRFLLDIIRALGSEDRLIMINLLRIKDRCTCELEVLINKSQGAVSRQLKILEEAGLVRGWKKGKFIHYSLIKPVFERFLYLLNEWADKTINWFGDLPTLSEI